MARKAGQIIARGPSPWLATSVMRWLVGFTSYVINRIITYRGSRQGVSGIVVGISLR